MGKFLGITVVFLFLTMGLFYFGSTGLSMLVLLMYPLLLVRSLRDIQIPEVNPFLAPFFIITLFSIAGLLLQVYEELLTSTEIDICPLYILLLGLILSLLAFVFSGQLGTLKMSNNELMGTLVEVGVAVALGAFGVSQVNGDNAKLVTIIFTIVCGFFMAFFYYLWKKYDDNSPVEDIPGSK